MKAGSAIYLDMEPYDITNTACNDAVLTYVRSFTKTLRAKSYRAGYYGFSSSSAKADRHRDEPDATCRATSGTPCGTARTPRPPTGPGAPALLTDHSRGHQYQVNSKETRGGYTITVDRDAWDGPVAIVG